MVEPLSVLRTFDVLLGAEIALSTCTGSCIKNAGDKGLQELAAVFDRQKIVSDMTNE